MGWTTFLLTYLLGGITFVPLVVAIVLAHAYYTLPHREDVDTHAAAPASDHLIQPGDDLAALPSAQKDKNESKARPTHQDSDVAAGYFAVCREYTPMGINAKPIERSTPVGSATVATPSPSVYQTMYRSIFDRKSGSGPPDNRNSASQRPKKAGNVFYVVLRHGHLMLFDDDEQLEVRHVVSLAHHDVSIYSGEAVTPEGELWIKRNAICLSRRADGPESGPDSQVSKPFYLFSENCSAKEDFYFALLRNQEQSFPVAGRPTPTPIQFEVKNIISLVQKLHSSEEHMQTRWLNAMIGRIFLGIYKTKDMENFMREKLTKKISRVKRPAFLSNIAIKGIDTGESAPYITNPRLRDLTVEGECCMEADMRYTGNFRLEVAATARIDLGARFKAREVNLVLAVVVRKLEGHVLLKVKPPPSNRLWFTFQQAPKMEMTIEPIVSSRQITYNVILRQIESRIKEVIAETIVLPFWDDTPFFNTEHKQWRGGIFHDDRVKSTMDLETAAAQEGDLDEVDRLEESPSVPETDLSTHVEKSCSTPVLEKKTSIGLFGRKMKSKTDVGGSAAASTTSLELPREARSSMASVESSARSSTASLDLKKETKHEPAPAPATELKVEASSPPPPSVVSAQFTRPATPTISTEAINADLFVPPSSPPNHSPALSAMATLTTKAQSPSPAQMADSSAFRPYITSKSSSKSSSSSLDVADSEKETNKTARGRRNTASSSGSHDDSASHSPSLSARNSVQSQTGSITKGFFARRDTGQSSLSADSPNQPNPHETHKKTALAAVTDAAATAKRWGWNAWQKRVNDKSASESSHDKAPPFDLKQPMGRGQPLPPPGTPLPMPRRKTSSAPIPAPKRKPVAPPPIPHHHEEPAKQTVERRPVPAPPLPKRRQYQSEEAADEDTMLVVAAPADSEPTTPLGSSHHPSYIQPFVEDLNDVDKEGGKAARAVDAPVLWTVEEISGESRFAPEIAADNPQQQDAHDSGVEPSELVRREDDDFSAWLENAGSDDLDVAVKP
ncbi:hypothetical protein QBC35DRAFT_84735 [Podospora australis]|uniref:SMP-LTD domain-containing protein n=1 Tax=Podospora australis TaxID=1536484 RepID=A0AAN6WKT1_9PEZI|nr:hypothetical protein QBC35DRAFT_84735 [Podospora australis]